MNTTIFGKKRYVTFDFNKAKRAKIKASAKAAAASSRVAASSIDSPPQAWPANVKKPIDKLVVELLDQYRWYGKLASSTRSNSDLLAAWNSKFPDYKSAELIRLRLGIPPAGKGCPK